MIRKTWQSSGTTGDVLATVADLDVADDDPDDALVAIVDDAEFCGVSRSFDF